MSDRIAISREQWPASSPTADRRRPHVRLPGAPGHSPAQSQPIQEQSLPGFQLMSTLDSPQQHARLLSEVFFTNRATERSPSWSASKALDTGLHSKPRAYKKRVRAEDLWDRDEEELLHRRRAKKLASKVSLAGVGEKDSQPESVGPSELPQDLHSFGGASDDLLHSDMTEDRERAYTRPQADAFNISQDDIPACSPESQSNERAYPWPQSNALNYAEDEIPSRAAESQSRPHLKRPLDRYSDNFEITEDTEQQPQKRRRNSAGYTEHSTHGTSQDAQPKHLEMLLDAAEKASKYSKRQKDKKPAAAVQREKNRAGKFHQTTLSADPPPVEIEHDGMNRLATTFPKFGSLPDNVQDIIFNVLLESPDPIKLNTGDLKAFARHSVAIPNPTSSTKIKKRIQHTLKPPQELKRELDIMKADMNNIPLGSWPSESVVSGLTLSLLFVSKSVHKRAARSFYGNNVFEFHSICDSWLHLASFLATIGPVNAGSIHHLSVAVPKWHPDTSHDRLAAAILDGLSPLTHLAARTTAARGPLFSAISKCAYILVARSGLISFQMDMQMNDVQSFLNHSVNASMYDLSKAQRKAHAKRKEKGAQMLLGLSRRALSSGCKPELVIHACGSDNKRKLVFVSLLPSIEATAKKYGWDLNHTLKVSDKPEAGDEPESGQPEASDELEAEEDE